MTSMTMDNALVLARANAVRRLAEDLAAVQGGHGPTPTQISAAPLINDWSVTAYIGYALRGAVSDLPGSDFTSRELFLLDPDRGYARTLTRFYRLGKPAEGHTALAGLI